MVTFRLPDLGEGLAEAELVEWHVKPGEHVRVDRPLVSVETAKALVEVPAPFSGTVMVLHGAAGDILATGAPLIDLEPSPAANDVTAAAMAGTAAAGDAPGSAGAPGIGVAPDAGTVVGSMPLPADPEFLDAAIGGDNGDHAPGAEVHPAVGGAGSGQRTGALPVARALARHLGVDLQAIAGSGPGGIVGLDDVLVQAGLAAPALAVPAAATVEPLRGARRAMAHSMSASRNQVAGSTVCDDADIHDWTSRGDYMPRLARALIAACAAEPALNAWYDAANRARILFEPIHLAIAVDTPGGLIVPVLRDIRHQAPDALRTAIAHCKDAAQRRSSAPEDLRGFTLMLSNFGTLAGRYGIPRVVPPAVAILGAGKVREDAVVAAGSVAAHRRMPLSLSFDHRCVTGGEACRFLAAVIADLQKPD